MTLCEAEDALNCVIRHYIYVYIYLYICMCVYIYIYIGTIYVGGVESAFLLDSIVLPTH